MSAASDAAVGFAGGGVIAYAADLGGIGAGEGFAIAAAPGLVLALLGARTAGVAMILGAVAGASARSRRGRAPPSRGGSLLARGQV